MEGLGWWGLVLGLDLGLIDRVWYRCTYVCGIYSNILTCLVGR